jgi:hypothetical protein
LQALTVLLLKASQADWNLSSLRRLR